MPYGVLVYLHGQHQHDQAASFAPRLCNQLSVATVYLYRYVHAGASMYTCAQVFAC